MRVSRNEMIDLLAAAGYEPGQLRRKLLACAQGRASGCLTADEAQGIIDAIDIVGTWAIQHRPVPKRRGKRVVV